MKEELRRQFEACIENGSEEDLKVLGFLLEGVKRKKDQKNSTFLTGIMQMEQKMGKDSCEITVPLNPVFHNNVKILHGGITATALDTVMGYLANFHLPKGYGAVTNQLNLHYIAPGIGDYIRCRSEIIHRGAKTMVVSGGAFRSDGKKIAYATGTFFIIEK